MAGLFLNSHSAHFGKVVDSYAIGGRLLIQQRMGSAYSFPMHMPIDAECLRDLAYRIWEQEGRPAGRDHENWQEAERQLALEFRIGFPDASQDAPVPAASLGIGLPAAATSG